MKSFTLLLFCSCFHFTVLKSQDFVVTKYYDSAWVSVNPDSARYFCNYKKQQTLYLCDCYSNSSGKLKAISMKEHMNLYSKTIGLSISYFDNNKIEESTLFDENGQMISRYKYYKNGQLADSLFYDEAENIDSAFHYYENGNTKAIYHFDYNTKIKYLTAYSANGKEINGIHYLAKARYKTGDDDWNYFIKQNLNSLTAVENKAPEGTYTVIVKFDIETDGSLSNIRAETNHEYGMEEAVIKLIKKSKKWTPEIFLGKPRLASRRQPVTFVVME